MFPASKFFWWISQPGLITATPEKAELSDSKVRGVHSFPALGPVDSNAHMGFLDHADVVAAITHCQS